MGELSKQWRARADELNTALPVLMTNISVPAQVIQATKAAVVPEILIAFANLLDVIETVPAAQGREGQLQRWAQRNREIRIAAVNALSEGKWDDFDRLIADELPGGGSDQPTGDAATGQPAGANT